MGWARPTSMDAESVRPFKTSFVLGTFHVVTWPGSSCLFVLSGIPECGHGPVFLPTHLAKDSFAIPSLLLSLAEPLEIFVYSSLWMSLYEARPHSRLSECPLCQVLSGLLSALELSGFLSIESESSLKMPSASSVWLWELQMPCPRFQHIS